MKIVIISFTKKGMEWNRKLTGLWRTSCPGGMDREVTGYSFWKFTANGLESFEKLDDVIKQCFQKVDGILVVGSTGIAVRAIAPYLRGKEKDPAVLVMDEMGEHVISLLSGHLGGANRWCMETAYLTGAKPVITTATDLNHKFAVDNFAKENHLRILDMKKIKEISGDILQGKRIRLESDFPIRGELPKELAFMGDEAKEQEFSKMRIRISYQEPEEENPNPWECRLMPMDVRVGMGCRKGKGAEELYSFLADTLKANDISEKRIRSICSIENKKEEEGLKKLAEYLQVPFVTYTKEQLGTLTGDFSSSEFVKRTVGVENVCERSAAYGEEKGEFLVRKQTRDGMSLAVYRLPVDIEICF